MNFLGVKIPTITRYEALQALKKPQIIFTPNPEILLEAFRNKTYRKYLNRGTLFLPDGHGLQLCAPILKYPIIAKALLIFPLMMVYVLYRRPFKKYYPEIIHGVDFMDDLIAYSASQGKTVFFLGAQRGVAEACAETFLGKYPSLKVVGTSSVGPNESALKLVRKARPEVLLVAYGAPKQETWIARHLNELKSIHTIMAVGGSFDFWSNKVKRSPLWLRTLGLEWVWRLLMEPKKRLRRIWNAVVVFPFMIVFSSKKSFQHSE